MIINFNKILAGILVLITGIYECTLAQEMHGKILSRDNESLPGAYVFLKRTDKHTHTNEFGAFTLDGVKVGDTLSASHIGFKPELFIVKDLTSPMNIVLSEQTIELSGVTITPGLDAINLFSKLDLNTTPVSSSQDVLQKVPGLIIGQHAGGGKAEQIFLRGFDIDHGTDIDITVDGMPVNMVSHAHGQGYSDLHFLIPETIEKIDFGKGPYYSDHGNFTTAGYVAFNTKEKLDQSVVKMELGQFNTSRAVGLFNILNNEERSAYVATEYQLSDGPFESPQNFKRLNVMSKYTTKINSQDKIAVQLSHFESKWDASGQIPQSLVNEGTLDRFGAIDDTEGGQTARTNFKFDYTKYTSDDAYIINSMYLSNYDFELYSNFTFFLEDPVNGDQIRQKENRQLFGVKSEWNKILTGQRFSGLLQVGGGLRNDRVDGVELSHTATRRTTLENIQLGNVDETNAFLYANAEIEFGRWFINPGVRLDHFNFNYNDELGAQYETQSASNAIVSPKLNILFNGSENIQYYFKTGVGFHSNDTRVVVAQNGRETLPAAYGSDLGVIWKPTSKLLINTALWALLLDQEFVYVGDAGIVEPSGRTRRTGMDLGIRYQLTSNLFLYSDINYAHARSSDDPDGHNFIPLAPKFTATGGFNVVNYRGFSGGMKYRYIQDRPANEDNSITAKGYFITDINMNYSWTNLSLGIAVQNLFDHRWNEAQFATESRVAPNVAPVEEIHFTPGTPFAIRANITYKF